MRARGLAAAVLLGVLSACTPMQWVKENAGPAQMRADLDACRHEAWQEAQVRSLFYRPFGPMMFHDPFGRRFLAWPYGPFADPFGDPFIEETRLTDFCMRAKGWHLEPVEKTAP